MAKRNQKRSKRRLNIKKVLIAIIILIVCIIGLTKFIELTKKTIIFNEYYISSDTNEVVLYSYDEENKIMSDIDKIYRGTKIKKNGELMTIGDVK